MSKISLVLGLFLLLGAALVQILPSGGTAQAATANVSVGDDVFVQANITITAGDTVHWTWAAGNVDAHSVTADDMSFDSNPASPFSQLTGTFDHTFSTPGTYPYYCKIHGAPGGNGMSGVITVQAVAPTATNTAAQATSTSTAAATASATPTAAGTSSPTPAGTQTAVATPAPQNTAAAPAATPRAAAAAGTSLPHAGDGPAGGGSPNGWLALALAAAGVTVLASGLLWRRRV